MSRLSLFLPKHTHTMKTETTLTEQMLNRMKWKATQAQLDADHAHHKAEIAFTLLAISVAINLLLLFL